MLRLAPGARVLVVPIPDNHFSQPMRWQADTGEPASMIGGFFLGPNQAGRTKVSPGPAGTDAQYLDPLWTGKAPSGHRSLAQLRAEYDVVICEGAGSPAEINLRDSDIANMGLARAAKLPVIVVGDIDRGGVFAAMFGTVALLSPGDQALIAGFAVQAMWLGAIAAVEKKRPA